MLCPRSTQHHRETSFFLSSMTWIQLGLAWELSTTLDSVEVV